MILYHHLGLGDHFVCNGLVNFISENYKQTIYLICKSKNLSTIKYLYSDNNNIIIKSIPGINEFYEVDNIASSIPNEKLLMVGFHHCDINNWDKSFYNQLNIPFEIRYSYFKLPQNKPNFMIMPPEEDFILIHSGTSIQQYNLTIKSNKKQIFVTDNVSNNLFSYLDIIYAASEIHCVNSSVFHLVDSLSNINADLYYHDIRKSDSTYFQVRDRWKTIKYL
jgi:hypothetical protein